MNPVPEVPRLGITPPTTSEITIVANNAIIDRFNTCSFSFLALKVEVF